jgi:peptidoglycan/LPS O-acetylase OafA/YrhL
MILMLPKLPAAWRRTLALALVLTVGVLPILALHLISVPVHQLWFVYIFPPTRLLEFMLGLLVALEVQAGGFRWLRLRYAAALTLLAYLLAGQAGIHRPDLVPGTMSYAAFTALPLALLIAATARADIGQAVSFLRSRWSVRLGEWSYAFYLVHLPIILTFEHAFGTHRADVWRALAATAVLLALSTAVAAALYTFVEHPMERRLRGSVRPSALILEAPGAIAVRQTLPEPRPQ